MIDLQEASIFKAISEEIRLRIMVLLTEGELCVCDLMQVLNLPQSSVSRHMAKLRSSQLVIDRRDGKWVHYRIHNDINERIPMLTDTLDQFRDRLPYQKDRENLALHLQTKNCE